MRKFDHYFSRPMVVEMAKVIRNSIIPVIHKVTIAREFSKMIENRNLFPFKKRDFVCIASGIDDKEIDNTVIFSKRKANK